MTGITIDFRELESGRVVADAHIRSEKGATAAELETAAAILPAVRDALPYMTRAYNEERAAAARGSRRRGGEGAR